MKDSVRHRRTRRVVLPVAVLILLGAAKKPDVPAPGNFWKPLPPPKTGEWLDVFPEKGQTFAEYKRSNPIRPHQLRNRIYVLPMLTKPPADRDILQKLRGVLGAFFGLDVRILSPKPLPKQAYRPVGRQFEVLKLVPALRDALPEDAVFLLAVTDRDLYLKKHGFTFGWAHFRLRVGIMSTARLGDRSDPRSLRRTLTLGLHESGHLLTLPHCVFYGCLMNGVRSVGETDRRPAVLCPVCLAKLCWATGADPRRRYREVERAYRAAGDSGAADQARAAADATRLGAKG